MENQLSFEKSYPNVNAHLHTPYSFSAFEKLTDALDIAEKEDVRVVGINDFYVMDGYDDWATGCKNRRLYPLFNIELIALQEEDRKNGIRLNDPNNPGRTYISGKGMRYPPELVEPHSSILNGVRKESILQVKQMCDKLNELLENKKAGFNLNFKDIENRLSRGLVRERHLAKALRIEAYKYFMEDSEKLTSFFGTLFGNKQPVSDTDDHASMENEIRGNLLKAGGPAFVPENPEAFPPLEKVKKLILAAGGIPTYPFLGDNATGGFTDFEAKIENATETLKQRGFYSAEFITTRNSLKVLEEYADYLNKQGFIVTLGSEHNTPTMEPVKLSARGGIPLTDKLKKINYEGACVIASHQERINTGKPGYINTNGEPDIANLDSFIHHGDELIKSVIK